MISPTPDPGNSSTEVHFVPGQRHALINGQSLNVMLNALGKCQGKWHATADSRWESS